MAFIYITALHKHFTKEIRETVF